MGENSKIEWCHHTFNGWWGCTRVSEACTNCYAESLAKRYGHDVWGKTAERRILSDAQWAKPLMWDRKAAEAGERHRVFCSSMADVFEGRDDLDEHRARLWDLIEATPNLDWLLLTKRPENVLRMVPDAWVNYACPLCRGSFSLPREITCAHHHPRIAWPSNAWIGTTVETQRWADERIPHLLAVPAPVRFLSMEPLLGPVDLGLGIDHRSHARDHITTDAYWQCLDCSTEDEAVDWTYTEHGISWVITGGESGPHARPTDVEWFRSIRDQCADAGVAYLHKQNGEWMPDHPGTERRLHRITRQGHETMVKIGKKNAGRELDGRTHDEFPDE